MPDPSTRSIRPPPRQVNRQAPCQARSRRTEQSLIETALRLYRERGVDAVTLQEIALAAGVAPATINRRFGDKDGLQREVFRTFIDSAMAMLDAIGPGPKARNLVDLTAQVAVVVLGFTRANQAYLQSAYARALVDDEYAAGIRELRGRVFAHLRAQLRSHVDEIGHPDPALAIGFALHQALAMLSARMDAGKLDVDVIDERVFFRELLRSLLAYLQVPASEERIDRALSAHGLPAGAARAPSGKRNR